MKKYFVITSALLFLGIGVGTAQFVTIPDANFAAYLTATIPAAMSGNQMDTTNPAVPALTAVRVENLGILDLTGVQYFRNLITLDCGNGTPSVDSNHIVSLPTLASTLDTLICGNNQITSLPALPGSLQTLKCYINKLTTLPTLPGTLTCLDCSSNQLTSLPALPTVLEYFGCEYNQIASLPTLPATLTLLYCDNNQITSLPTLPGNIGTLYCGHNLLTSLPALPGTITNLECGGNFYTTLPTLPGSLVSLICNGGVLTSIPALPGTLQYFQCYYNQITSLPTLPPTLYWFMCWNNQLTSLPALPSTLSWLDCHNNNISCFPTFPTMPIADSSYFNISGNPFTCLPNYIPAMRPAILAYPLCAPGNVNSCPSAYGIVGYTYRDMNSDCIRDAGDSNLVNIPMKIYDAGNNLLSQTYTAINGVYDFQDTGATYKVLVDTSGSMPFVAQCAHPGLDSVLSLTNIDTNINFSLTCKAGFDVGVQSVVTTGLIFPGMQHDLSVVAGDMSQWYNLDCANGDSGTVQIAMSGPVTYVGPGAGALTPIVSGNVFTYHIANYGAINNNTAFNLIFTTDVSAHAGDVICADITVTPLADNNPSNNTYNYCYTVVNSHDPNSKTTYPTEVVPGYTGWFTYTINFQNTGSAPAANILLTDTLDNNLNLKTFQLINYSHKNTTSLTGNVLTVRFNNINLPDSTVSPAGSTGFIQYRIKPNPGMLNGSMIKNSGNIYFDFNSPIITDTTTNLFTVVASVNSVVENVSCKVFPNPNNGQFTIILQNATSKCHVLIYNELGQAVYSSNLNTNNTQVNLSDKATGVYFYRIITENGQLVSDGKLIVE